jgi:transposase
MLILGCDYHPSWQQICWMDLRTGETGEKKLEHAQGEAERYYRALCCGVRTGMESTGNCQWFTELVVSLGHELWVGDAARIRAAEVRPQKQTTATRRCC